MHNESSLYYALLLCRDLLLNNYTYYSNQDSRLTGKLQNVERVQNYRPIYMAV